MQTGRTARACALTMVMAIVAMLLPAAASAHLERPSYWPDPAPDTAVTPAAGGGVPKARSLASTVASTRARRGPGKVHVVCQGRNGATSMRLLERALTKARKQGVSLRPSQPAVKISAKQARKLRAINRKLRDRCKHKAVQAAVDAAGNNDRIVIMPGTYTEPAARAQPENDPRCNPSLLQRDASGSPTPSYAYQVKCPHDQNLIYVQGREVVGQPLAEPRANRRGIPKQELGKCVRCNLQMEGSGPSPDDVILDAGKDYDGKDVEARPAGHAKDVVLRVDRGDGFVGRNFVVRGALEHGFYTEETDGVLLTKMKFFWNADYGHLAFTSDHQRIEDCDAMGAGDAALYPGAAPETGSQTSEFYGNVKRSNTQITRCDMRNSALGYSGSMGNAVQIGPDNHIYGNTAGIASDTLSSAGHPGFPSDSLKIVGNFIYANNFNTYSTDSPVKPLVTVPLGTGIVLAGMNDAVVQDNWFFDNWRYGAMLFAVPDALTSFGGPEGEVIPGVSCAGAPANGLSTSCGNTFTKNRMGQTPPGFRYPAVLDKYKVPHGNPVTEARLPNATDFWWDEFLSNRWNCWYGNAGPDGTPTTITGPGAAGPTPSLPPDDLPSCGGGPNKESSVGLGDVAKLNYLLTCSEGPKAARQGVLGCDWYLPATKPGGASAARTAEVRAASREFAGSAEGKALQRRMEGLAAGALP